MLKRGYKLIISVVLVATLFIGFGSAFASASTPVWLLRAKAGVAAAMLASQLVLHPVDVVLDSPIAQAVDPLGKNEWVETLPEYLDRSTIKVVEDTVIIDGVSYSDVWLGPDAANSLRLQGLDFATAYNILNNQSEAITYASGKGTVGGVPVYEIDGSNRYYSQKYYFSGAGTYEYGDMSTIVGAGTSSNTYSLTTVWADGSSTLNYTADPVRNAPYGREFSTNQNGYAMSRLYRGGSWTSWGQQTNSRLPTVLHDFSFDYVSGEIDAPLAEDDGLLVRVPSSYTDPDSGTVIYDIHDFTINYPDINQPGGHEINIDPSLNPDFQTDVNLGNGIGDLLLTIFGLDLLNKIINFAPEPTTPEPGPQPGVIDPLPDPDPAPDEPTSGTTIADTDWTKLDELLRWIQSTIDSIRHITESLQTMLDSLFDRLQNLIETLESLPQQILEDIETGPSKVFRKALDILKSLFMPLLLPIKAMMGLWHYVVEWLASVNAPFVWIFGVMSGASANMVLPIYAALAGSICIAIYKALGR